MYVSYSLISLVCVFGHSKQVLLSSIRRAREDRQWKIPSKHSPSFLVFSIKTPLWYLKITHSKYLTLETSHRLFYLFFFFFQEQNRWRSQNLLTTQPYQLFHTGGTHTCICSGYSLTDTRCVRSTLIGCIISWNDGKDSYRTAHLLIRSKHKARHDNLLM